MDSGEKGAQDRVQQGPAWEQGPETTCSGVPEQPQTVQQDKPMHCRPGQEEWGWSARRAQGTTALVSQAHKLAPGHNQNPLKGFKWGSNMGWFVDLASGFEAVVLGGSSVQWFTFCAV